MAKIYQLMIGKEQIGDVYYFDKHEAIYIAEEVAEDSGKNIEIWEAEEIEGTPYDALKWSIIGVARD